MGSEQSVALVEGKAFGMAWIEWVGSIQSRSASRLSWHAHPGLELLFVLDGATNYETEAGIQVELSGGSFAVVPPHTLHRGSQDVRMPARLCGLRLAAPDLALSSTHEFNREEMEWILAQLEQNALVPHPMGPGLHRTIRLLAERVSEFLRGRNTVESLLGLRLSASNALFEAAQQCSRSTRVETGNVISRACRHLESHSSKPLEIQTLEKITGYSRARLFQLFKQQTGLSPNDYLQRLRIRTATQRLAAQNLSITQIAHDLGFSSSQYFSKVFRKYEGQTPSEWRTRHRQEVS